MHITTLSRNDLSTLQALPPARRKKSKKVSKFGRPARAAMNDSTSWPIGKLLANMDKGILENRRLAVLLSTGGLNPIHNGHLDLFHRAKRCLESEHDFAVVGGFISPSHDLYVGPKCKAFKSFHFSANERLKLTQLACQDSEWLECASWESERKTVMGNWPRSCDFPVVVEALQDFLSSSEQTKMHSFTVLYVCGLDHAMKCSLEEGFGRSNQGVVIVPRSDMPPAASKPDLLVYGVTETNSKVEHLSSTVVRHALREGTPIDPSWMSEPVATELCRIYAQKTALSRALASNTSPRPRLVFISLSIIMREFPSIPIDVLEDSLFFFGSKRMWIWPTDDAAMAEAAQQPGNYCGMADGLRELLKRKDEQGEVCFLKPDELGEPDEVVFGDYAKASAWLAQLTDPRTGAPYGPLRLEREWWEQSFGGGRFVPRGKWQQVVQNFESGLHSYNEVRARGARTREHLRARARRQFGCAALASGRASATAG
jgi:phosphopantetheine adenylyltransferase